MIDDFVGTFHGPLGQVEVLAWQGELVINGYNKIYPLKCHICAKDPELFRDALYTSNKGNLKLGQLPCGCGKAPRWTEEQQEIRIRRLCDIRGYIFYGFESEPVKTGTKICLGCKNCLNVWNTCTINNFTNHDNGHGCPVCAKSGYKQDKVGYLYVLKVQNGETGFTGYGISNVINQRLSKHRTNLKKFGYKIVCFEIFELSGLGAMIYEDLIRMNFEQIPQFLEGFKTEATHLSLYKDVLQFIRTTKIGGV